MAQSFMFGFVTILIKYDLNFNTLAHHGARLLKQDGNMSIVVPFHQAQNVLINFGNHGLFAQNICSVQHHKNSDCSIQLIQFKKQSNEAKVYSILPCRNGIFDARKAASLSRPTPAHVNVILEWFENSTDAYLAWCMMPFFNARTVSFAFLIFKDDAKSLPRPSGNTVINPPVSTACCATMFCSPSPPQETTISPFNIASLAAWPECSCELATKTCDLFG